MKKRFLFSLVLLLQLKLLGQTRTVTFYNRHDTTVNETFYLDSVWDMEYINDFIFGGVDSLNDIKFNIFIEKGGLYKFNQNKEKIINKEFEKDFIGMDVQCYIDSTENLIGLLIYEDNNFMFFIHLLREGIISNITVTTNKDIPEMNIESASLFYKTFIDGIKKKLIVSWVNP